MISFKSIFRRSFLVPFALLWIVAGCWSSSDNQEEELPAKPEETVESSAEAQPAETTEKSDAAQAEEAAPAPESSTAAPAAEAPPPAASAPAPQASAPVASAPSSGATVQYVSAKTATLYEKPDRSSQKIRSLSKGDHLLVTIEGEWARTDEGRYVEAKFLSSKPIGKKKEPARWK